MIEPSATAERVMAFANTVDLEERTDAISVPELAAPWLGVASMTHDEHQSLLDLRAGVRAALGAAGEQELAVGEAVLGRLPLFAGLTDVLVPSADLGVFDQRLAELGIAWVRLVLTGESARLKRCADDTCGWVFWDVSRNNSRRWCTMRVCGNRAKARRYSEKQRSQQAL